MRRVVSLYIWSPEKRGVFLFRQHKCTQKAHWAAENLTKGHPCWYPGKRDPSSAALHHCEPGTALALTSCRAQWVILIFRNGYFASIFPMETEVWVPNRCTAELQHCCHHHLTGTRTQQVHQLLPHPGRENMNKPWEKCGVFFLSKKPPFPAAGFAACFTFPVEQTQMQQMQPKVVLFILYTHIHKSLIVRAFDRSYQLYRVSYMATVYKKITLFIYFSYS